MAPGLEARGLTRRFGSFVALDRLDLHVEGSKCVGFLGPNGAGKTTTLKMFTDLIFPSEGEAFVNGISVQADRKRALSSCGVLIETPEIYGSLTPKEALEMVGSLRGMPSREVRLRTDEVLAEVRMTEWADQKVGRFSKGMKQRVNIASTLLSDPEVLLLDEPSTGLDPRGVSEVRDIIRGLKRGRRLVFFSSHLLSEVVDVCDEVALLNHGHLLFYDSLENVTRRFAAGTTDVVVEFLEPIPDDVLASSISPLPGVTAWTRQDPRHLTLTISGGAPSKAGVLESLVGLHKGLVSFRESRSALEEVYLSQITDGES
jgi:ABC-2 type transport system ATP-binding protein